MATSPAGFQLIVGGLAKERRRRLERVDQSTKRTVEAVATGKNQAELTRTLTSAWWLGHPSEKYELVNRDV